MIPLIRFFRFIKDIYILPPYLGISVLTRSSLGVVIPFGLLIVLHSFDYGLQMVQKFLLVFKNSFGIRLTSRNQVRYATINF